MDKTIDKNFKIEKIVTDNFINLRIIEKNRLAIAELSLIDREMARTYLYETGLDLDKIEKIYFFNRLSIPKELRNRGMGGEIMKELIRMADKDNFLIINTANSYGEMSQNDLISWYQKFNMKLLNEDGLLIYHSSLKTKNKPKF